MSAIKAVRKMQQIYAQRKREGLAQIWSDFTKQLVSTRTRQGLQSAARRNARQTAKSRSITKSAIVRKQPMRARPTAAEEQRISKRNLHFMRLRRHQWQLMAKRLKRLKQGIIIENRRRKWNESKIWRKMAKVLKVAAKTDRFDRLRKLRKEANAIALEYVNELLKDFGMSVKRLEELPVRTSDGENRRIPAFDSRDEVMGVFVNKALARYSLPMIGKRASLNRSLRHSLRI